MAATTEAPDRVQLEIEGMTCAACATRIEKKLNRLDGVEATVNFATEEAAVSFDARQLDVETLIEAVATIGYHATLAGQGDRGADPTTMLRHRLVVAAVLTTPVVLLAMIPALRFEGWQWVALVLSTPVVMWAGWPFHRAAFENARHGAATMDTLISIGTLSAWLWSAVVLIGAVDADTYFEVAAVITTLILLGRYFESRARRRSGEAIGALLELGAKEAVVLREGRQVQVPVEELVVGDLFVVRPGEKIATDGVVVEGRSTVDQSLLTGEPVPVDVAPGADVAGGTINASGRLVVQATKVGADTALAQIARLVAEAQTGKAPVQRLVDRVSAVFVPIVFGISAATLVGWLLIGGSVSQAFTAAVAVLIIACPCALGLATPTALLVGTGRGAQLGILIRGPEVLEQTRRITTIVLDKTGTVTEGKMQVVGIVTEDGVDQRELLRLAGSAEDASEHPIARAIAERARTELGRLDGVESFSNRAGTGIEAVVDGRAVVVGRPSTLMSEWGLELSPDLVAAKESAESSGQTVVLAAWDGHARGLFVVGDRVKPTSAAAVRALGDLGLTTVLLTGDNARSCSGGRGRSRHRARPRRRPPPGQGRRGGAPPGRRRGGGDGRRRCQRRTRARPGRPRAGDRHRHRHRDRSERHHPRLGRPAWRRRRDPARPKNTAHDQGQPLLGLRLQRRRHTACRRRPPQPDRRGRRDGVLERLRRHQQPASSRLPRTQRRRAPVSETTTTRRYGYVADKTALIKRLHRIEGQVRGIERMVDEERYCIDILTQIAAVTTALETVGLKVLDEHVRHCVTHALASGDEAEAKEKTDELLAAVQRFMRTR